MNKKDPPQDLPQITVQWWQAPTQVATEGDKLPYYQAVLDSLAHRIEVFPQIQFEFINDPVTDTINLAGETLAFANLEQDLLNAGFRPKEIPNLGMDGYERNALKELILNGGKYNG